MPNLNKIESSEVKLGMCFSMPVFFDDGKNMFLAKHHAVKKYHIDALSRWNIPFVLTAGKPILEVDTANEKEFAKFANAGRFEEPEEVEELDELDELEELEELEEIE